jgi:FKBP-type peptidyl-prolyl cis-trans isomerase FklB
LIGLNFGEQIHRLGITNEISTKDIARGINDALAGKKFEREDQQRIQAFIKSVLDQVVGRNRAAAAKFLAENAKAEGVKSLPSGLEYKVIAPGDPTGTSPIATDQVTVQYRGKLLNGTEFDSSYARGQAATFTLSGVIKGWQEAVALMKPGAKWELFVPPELGYDAVPKPGIPGGSLLIFEVELLGVKPPAAPAAAAPPGGSPPPKAQNPAAAPGKR